MSRFIDLLMMSVIGAAVVCATVPSLVRLANALVPLVIVVGIVVAVVRAIFFVTQRW